MCNQVGSYEVVLNDFEGISNTAEIIYNVLLQNGMLLQSKKNIPTSFNG